MNLTPERIALGIIYYVVLLFSLSVHESAHGWMAWQMGDDTAVSQGRVSLNPLVHIDLIGTVLMPVLMFLMSSSGIPLLAWAKPTPVGAHNFRKLAKGHILVAGAGPASNLILAMLFTGALFAAVRAGVTDENAGPLLTIITTGVVLNVALAVFNLVPLPPLDGSWIASWALPRPLAAKYDRIVEPYGQWILLILFGTGILGSLIRPFIELILMFVKFIVY